MKSKRTEKIKRTTVYSAAHFLMDFLCAFYMLRMVSQLSFRPEYLLLYNFFAFAVQMPLGLVADRLRKNRMIAAGGFLLLAFSYFVSPLKAIPVFFISMAGLGNAMFHVGGGLEILNADDTKNMSRCSSLGIFVSPGAFGLYLGTILAGNEVLKSSFGVAAVIFGLLCLIAFFVLLRFPMTDTTNAEFSVSQYIQKKESQGMKGSAVFCISLICLFLVVCLRSYLGIVMAFPWKAEYGLLCIGAVVLGKTAGGIACDLFGVTRTVICSLLLASVCFLFSNQPVFGLAAIFLFQMTMPITLKAVSVYLNGAKGFGFGLLTFALFIGFLFPYLKVELIPQGAVWYSLVSAISLLLLVVGINQINKNKNKEEKS